MADSRSVHFFFGIIPIPSAPPGNAISLVTGTISSALFSHVSTKVIYINFIEGLGGPSLMSSKGTAVWASTLLSLVVGTMLTYTFSPCNLLLVPWFVSTIAFTKAANIISSVHHRSRYSSSPNYPRSHCRCRHCAVFIYIPTFAYARIQRHN